MDKPLVSIVTPSFNQAAFIEDTLLSVKHQDYPNLEHIVVDGGSTDRTLSILKHYENEYNLQWISEPDNGQSHAINKGFQLTKGEIIGWINSDDVYMQSAVSEAVCFLQNRDDLSWVYGNAYWVDENNRILRLVKSKSFDLKQLICASQYIIQPTVFFRHRIFDIVGMLDEHLHASMDYDFFIRIGTRFDAGYINKELATRRIHPNAKTSKISLQFSVDAITTLDKAFSDPNLPEEIILAKHKAYSIRYAQWGRRCFQDGQFKEARKHFFNSFRLSPFLSKRSFANRLLMLFQSFLGVNFFIPGNTRMYVRDELYEQNDLAPTVNWFKTYT